MHGQNRASPRGCHCFPSLSPQVRRRRQTPDIFFPPAVASPSTLCYPYSLRIAATCFPQSRSISGRILPSVPKLLPLYLRRDFVHRLHFYTAPSLSAARERGRPVFAGHEEGEAAGGSELREAGTILDLFAHGVIVRLAK